MRCACPAIGSRQLRPQVVAQAFTTRRPAVNRTSAGDLCGRRATLAVVPGFLLPLFLNPTVKAEEASTLELPKAYQRTAQQLVKGMKTTIELELSGAEERKVRRVAAENHVTELVKEFLGRWQDDPSIRSDPARAQIKEAIAELGEYYLKNGQRTKLTKEVSDSILYHLDLAEAALPPIEESKFMGFF